ncbi:hypothetical protein BC629DRAFT_831898 [Irpex lacteus]|nr:hypothetical protein BC629DRAFT_831898 [Irpex lacteus]
MTQSVDGWESWYQWEARMSMHYLTAFPPFSQLRLLQAQLLQPEHRPPSCLCAPPDDEYCVRVSSVLHDSQLVRTPGLGIPSSQQSFSIPLPLSSVALIVTSAAASSSKSLPSSSPVIPTRLPLPPVDPASATTVASVSSAAPRFSSSQVSLSTAIPTTHLPAPPATTAVEAVSHSPVTSSFTAEITPPPSTLSSAVDMSPKASRRVRTTPVNQAAASPPSNSGSDSGSSSPSVSASTPADTPAKQPGSSAGSSEAPSASKSSPPFSLPAAPPSSSSDSAHAGSPTVSPVKPHTETQSPGPSSPPFQVPTQSPTQILAPTQSGSGGNFRTISTSTITEPPESTLSSPVFVTGTDSKGRATPSIPPVITSVGVSTEPDGVLVSVTHIIANPTGIWGIGDTTAATKHGFLANGGAVAGVFVVVGLIVATIAAIISFIMCKRRRRRRIRLSISKPLPMPDNPFEDPRESPSPTQMRYAPSDASHRNLVGTGVGLNTQPRQSRNLLDDEIEEIPGPVMAHLPRTSGFAGVGAGDKSIGRPAFNALPSYNGPFSSYTNPNRLTHSSRPSYGSSSVGVAITTDEPQQTSGTDNSNLNASAQTPRHLKHASLTPSTPSIYPPSLPNVDDSTDTATITDDTHNLPITPSTDEAIQLPLGTVDLNSSEAPMRPPRRRPAPPLPPRSPLRPSSKHGENTLDLTISTQLSPAEQSTTSPQASAPEAKKQTITEEYEPLTPPASAISFSGSSSDSGSSGRESRQSDVVMPRPIVARPSPTMSTFEEYNRMMARKTSITGIPVSEGAGKKGDNFYTRRKVVNAEVRLFYSRSLLIWC